MHTRNLRNALRKSVAKEKNDHVTQHQFGQSPQFEAQLPKTATRPACHLPTLPNSVAHRRAASPFACRLFFEWGV